jgi:hypothetical protein
MAPIRKNAFTSRPNEISIWIRVLVAVTSCHRPEVTCTMTSTATMTWVTEQARCLIPIRTVVADCISSTGRTGTEPMAPPTTGHRSLLLELFYPLMAALSSKPIICFFFFFSSHHYVAVALAFVILHALCLSRGGRDCDVQLLCMNYV